MGTVLQKEIRSVMEGGATQVMRQNNLPQRPNERAIDEKVIVGFRIREAKEANIWTKGR